MNKKYLAYLSIFTIILVLVGVYWRYRQVKTSTKEPDRGIVEGKVTSEVENCKDTSKAPVTKPYALKSVYIRQGNTNDVEKDVFKMVLTDENGNFSISLPKGQYCFVFSDKYQKFEVPDNVIEELGFDESGKVVMLSKQLDPACYADYQSKCDLVVDVKKNSKTDVTMTKKYKCDEDCLTVVGSAPVPGFDK